MIVLELICPAALFGSPGAWMFQALLRLGAAAVMGAVIGTEREHHGRSAGLRTHLLVALGSALVMLVSLRFGRVFGGPVAGGTITVDPARVAYGVMGGIGFIGAGAIIRYGAGVRGLTTAASLWCSAAVGLACGFGMFATATAATVMVLLALTVLANLEHLIPSRHTKTLTLQIPLGAGENLPRFADLLQQKGARVVDLQCTRDMKSGTETLTYHLSMPSTARPDELLEIAEGEPDIIRLTVR